MRRALCGFVAAAFVLAAGRAEALTIGFTCVPGAPAASCASGEAQLRAELSAGPSAGEVRFDFTNLGTADASITDIYFDAADWLVFAFSSDGPGVDFEPGARPRNLPGGGMLTPAFETSFGADSEAPSVRNGIDPGETLALVFRLGAGRALADVAAALADGSLRIGLHVQGFSSGGSASFVNVAPGLPPEVPKPDLAWLLGAGLLARWLGKRSAS